MPGRYIPGFTVQARNSSIHGWVWEIRDESDKLVETSIRHEHFKSAPAARKDGEARAFLKV